jgi:hypothetical protein
MNGRGMDLEVKITRDGVLPELMDHEEIKVSQLEET